MLIQCPLDTAIRSSISFGPWPRGRPSPNCPRTIPSHDDRQTLQQLSFACSCVTALHCGHRLGNSVQKCCRSRFYPALRFKDHRFKRDAVLSAPLARSQMVPLLLAVRSWCMQRALEGELVVPLAKRADNCEIESYLVWLPPPLAHLVIHAETTAGSTPERPLVDVALQEAPGCAAGRSFRAEVGNGLVGTKRTPRHAPRCAPKCCSPCSGRKRMPT